MDEELARRVRGRTVAILRAMRGWLLIDLAAALGVTHTVISHWESGRKVPEMETLERITAAAGFRRSHLRQALALAESACRALDGLGRPPEDDPEPEIDDLAIQAGRMVEHYTRQRLRLEWQQAAAEPDKPCL